MSNGCDRNNSSPEPSRDIASTLKISGMLKQLLKKFFNVTYRPLALWYLRKDRRYHFHELNVVVKSGVFHPRLFFSTELLIRHLSDLDLTGKRFLELGAGTGLISMLAKRRGALVTASDISQSAVDNIIENARINHLHINVKRSDLFDELSGQDFDVILINPPFFLGKPITESDYAWFCGENLDYFQELFAQLSQYLAQDGFVRMILSEDCQIERIRQIASANDFEMKAVVSARVLWEAIYIFDLRPNDEVSKSGWYRSNRIAS